MQAHWLLNRYTHTVIHGCTIRIKQEVLRIDRVQGDADTILLSDTDGCLTCNAGDSLSSWNVLFNSLNYEFTNACTVDLSHQANLVDTLTDLVLVEVLHHLSFEHTYVDRLTIHILNVIFNVEVLTLTEHSFHDLSMGCFNGLLSGGGDDTTTFRLTSGIGGFPLTTEDTLILFPTIHVVVITEVSPTLTVIHHPSD